MWLLLCNLTPVYLQHCSIDCRGLYRSWWDCSLQRAHRIDWPFSLSLSPSLSHFRFTSLGNNFRFFHADFLAFWIAIVFKPQQFTQCFGLFRMQKKNHRPLNRVKSHSSTKFPSSCTIVYGPLLIWLFPCVRHCAKTFSMIEKKKSKRTKSLWFNYTFCAARNDRNIGTMEQK